MSGTCGGTLTGNTFVTAPITGDCTVLAEFDALPIPTMNAAMLVALAVLLAMVAGGLGRRRLGEK